MKKTSVARAQVATVPCMRGYRSRLVILSPSENLVATSMIGNTYLLPFWCWVRAPNTVTQDMGKRFFAISKPATQKNCSAHLIGLAHQLTGMTT